MSLFLDLCKSGTLRRLSNRLFGRTTAVTLLCTMLPASVSAQYPGRSDLMGDNVTTVEVSYPTRDGVRSDTEPAFSLTLDSLESPFAFDKPPSGPALAQAILADIQRQSSTQQPSGPSLLAVEVAGHRYEIVPSVEQPTPAWLLAAAELGLLLIMPEAAIAATAVVAGAAVADPLLHLVDAVDPGRSGKVALQPVEFLIILQPDGTWRRVPVRRIGTFKQSGVFGAIEYLWRAFQVPDRPRALDRHIAWGMLGVGYARILGRLFGAYLGFGGLKAPVANSVMGQFFLYASDVPDTPTGGVAIPHQPRYLSDFPPVPTVVPIPLGQLLAQPSAQQLARSSAPPQLAAPVRALAAAGVAEVQVAKPAPDVTVIRPVPPPAVSQPSGSPSMPRNQIPTSITVTGTPVGTVTISR